MAYGYLGSIKTKSGYRDAVVDILLRGSEALGAIGCQLYVVSAAETDPDIIWVTEVWTSKADHDASLELPLAKAAIVEAMPMLTGEFTSQELHVLGGLGL